MGKIKQQIINSRTEFFYYAFRNILLIGLPFFIISALILSHLSIHSSATSSGTDNLAITISSSCTLGSVINTPHSKEVYNGNYETNIGKTTIKTLCNDGNGYAIYANGYSNNEEGNNKLINSTYPQYSINTGLATSGLTSQWAMKLNNIEDDPSPTPPVIEQDYNNTYGIVPNYWTKVASRPSGTTDMSEGSSFTTTYSVYASSSQFAGTYVGQVKYLLTHPSTTNTQLFMQDATAIKNSLLNTGDSMQVIDQRDGKKYWVARLADGNIWMTQNLDFDMTTNTTLNSQTTDLNVAYDSSTGQYAEYNDGYTEDNGIIYYTPASSATTIDFTGTTVTGWQISNTAPYTASKTDSTETGHASIGNYYNWTAVIASNDSSNLVKSTYDDVANNPQNSICPKGWRLPTISSESEAAANSTNEFAKLNYYYSESLKREPLWFVLGGLIDSSLSYFGTDGIYWSSSTENAANAYQARIVGNMDTNAVRSRARGSSVRCLAR